MQSFSWVGNALFLLGVDSLWLKVNNLLVEGLWWNAKDNVTFSTKFHCTIVVLPETPPEADTFLYVIIIHTPGFHGEELGDSLPYIILQPGMARFGDRRTAYIAD